MIEAVIFDMDGLLLDTERLVVEAFVETRAAFGLPDGRDIILGCIGLRGDKTRDVLKEVMPDNLFDDFNLEWERRNKLRLQGDIPLRPGARELLARLSERGMPMGVATSTRTEVARSHLGHNGLLPFLTHVVGGDLVARPKPEPEVYLTVAGLLGVDARNCIAFEDSETGTRAAIASGARVVQVPDLVQPSDALRAEGHVIAPSLLDGAAAVGLI